MELIGCLVLLVIAFVAAPFVWIVNHFGVGGLLFFFILVVAGFVIYTHWDDLKEEGN